MDCKIIIEGWKDIPVTFEGISPTLTGRIVELIWLEMESNKDKVER